MNNTSLCVMKITSEQTLDQLADDLTILADLDTGLPEIISRDDLMHHEWLRRLMLAADSISNRIGRDDLSWLKENAP